MKTLTLSILLAACISSEHARCEVPAINTISPEKHEKTRFLNPRYLSVSPETPGDGKLPLLIFLHGSGERGEDLGKLKGQTIRLWDAIKKSGKGPCILIVPQCPLKRDGEQGSIWMPEDLDILLADIRANFPIDEKRILLTGFSMGGYGSWAWGAHKPELFAAIAPICGGTGPGGPLDVTPHLREWAAELAKVPVYAFVGAKDKVVPPDRSETMIAEIRKAGGKHAKLKIFPDKGHDALGAVISSQEFFDWMFSDTHD